jgi:putative membrane protein insertion efficiency factor
MGRIGAGQDSRDLHSSPRSLVLRVLGWYHRRISPLFPARCKYYPTCSQYMEIAIRRFGAFRGILLGLLRLLRCQPWVQGGIDDVPHRFSLFYRFRWSKAHEEPTTEPIIARENQSGMN